MSTERFGQLGERLRSRRIAARLNTEQAAQAAGISRALLYRYESGDVVKLEVLDKLARLYETSTAALLGPGNEYITQGVRFFERVQRLEEQASQVTIVFGPMAYMLSSDEYDRALALRMTDVRVGQPASSAAEAAHLSHVLARRKAAFAKNRPSLVNVVPLGDVERYLAQGLGGHARLPSAQQALRREAARREIERLAGLVASPPLGVQIGFTRHELPTAGFEIVRTGERKVLVTSPFRIVEPINLHFGVAVISEDAEALRLHETLVDTLWATALKGAAASTELSRLLRDA